MKGKKTCEKSPKLTKWQLKNPKCDKTLKLKICQTSNLRIWQNSKTHNVTQLKNSKWDWTQQLTEKNLNETRPKHSKCDQTQKLKMWQKLKTQNAIKFKISKCDKSQKVTLVKNSKCDKTQKLEMWHLKNSKCDNSKKKSKYI